MFSKDITKHDIFDISCIHVVINETMHRSRHLNPTCLHLCYRAFGPVRGGPLSFSLSIYGLKTSQLPMSCTCDIYNFFHYSSFLCLTFSEYSGSWISVWKVTVSLRSLDWDLLCFVTYFQCYHCCFFFFFLLQLCVYQHNYKKVQNGSPGSNHLVSWVPSLDLTVVEQINGTINKNDSHQYEWFCGTDSKTNYKENY